MSAPHPRELLELYLLGELSEEQCDAVEAWLQEDAAHARELEAAERTLAAFDTALAAPEGADALADRVLARAHGRDEEEPETTPKLFPVRAWGLGTVAAAAAVAVLLIVLGPSGPQPEPMTLASLQGWAVRPSVGADYRVLDEGRLRLDRGELGLASTPGAAPLVVETPHGHLQASGTRFVVGTHDTTPKGSNMNSLTRVLVLSGLVSLGNSLGSVGLRAGEWAVVDDEQPPIKFAAAAQSQMGLELYRQLAALSTDRNLCLSPTSIAQAFALLAEGADGPVLEALAELLGLPADARAIPGEGQAFTASLMQLRTGLLELNRHFAAHPHQRLDIANALWVDRGLPLAPAFQHAAQAEWQAEIHRADFREHAERERQKINAWVEERTQGHIPELLSAGDLDALSRVVITNALYFQANWEEPFPASSGDGEFTRADGSKVRVPFMHQAEHRYEQIDGELHSTPLSFPYGSFDADGARIGSLAEPAADGVQILSYPYEGGRLSMDFLLPGRADGLAALEKALSESWLRERLAQLESTSVKISLPRFEVSSRTDLKPLLCAMGLEGLFARQGLRNLAEGPQADELYVSGASHETWLKVDETGTEAAAATAVRIRALSLTASFRADRPFVYLIRDNETGAILFVGRMADPSAD